ncbi:polyphosphate kinase 1 [Shewanella sp. WXL01]|uniref:polyphosphate kinase 1 n=1 Tax=Shewanella sp. WXL01 TaxID=2709721 RepID=UPI0014386818|nr:polyphosphate kinase 1 [Shewanella sp. WXL01]NKF50480.1 polyphosphate kinase 1 [Shewanella sp. WXL01]
MADAQTQLFIEKELSWLSFNERVLQEAFDKAVPLIERVRFLGIFSSNMDEFFQVRVAAVRRSILLTGFGRKQQKCLQLMNSIQQKVLKLQEKFDLIYQELMKELARCNIFLINESQLSEFHSAWLRKYFNNQLKRHIAPHIITDESDLVQHLVDGTTYLVASLKKANKEEYALVEVPNKSVPRFLELPSEKGTKIKHLILLDNIIRHCIDDLFTPFFDYDSIEVFSMKMTRDAEYDVSNELEKTTLEQMTMGIKKRLNAQPVRLVYDRNMPQHMLNMLKAHLNISSTETECLIPGGRYHSFRDFMDFPNPGRKKLINEKLHAIDSQQFLAFDNSFEAIRHKDIMLNYPYHKFSHFTELVRQAAYDPAVSAIRINLYRVAKKSHIMQSLIDGVKNGKRVTAVIELRARFDEESNINWTRRLAEAGVNVHHGIPSLKIHSKLCLITRKEHGKNQYYCHVGSGNFNEGTARFYTDFSLFTANQEIAKEVKQVFDLIEHPYRKDDFKHLIVSPYNSRGKLLSLIDNEITLAKQKRKAHIQLKLNNLVDKQLIDKLYEASQAGVQIQLLIRGMCSLVPQIPGISDNIKVVSIIDRYLEHSRVMYFHANGEQKLFIGSADWMSRNIDERVEVFTPVYDEQLKTMICDIIDLQFRDNTKARVINLQQDNRYQPRGNKRKLRSQIAIHDYLLNHEKRVKKQLEIKSDTIDVPTQPREA